MALYGILGGMGTASGIYFQQLFFEICFNNGIRKDQDYPEWLYLNASKAPDRTAAIKSEAPSPVEYLVSMLERMELAGVAAVVVTCNSAHAFYDDIYQQVQIPWIHLPRETARSIRHNTTGIPGIMTTEGAVRSGIFRKAMEHNGLPYIEPDPDSSLQADIMSAIYNPEFGIKHTGSQIHSKAVSLLKSSIKRLDADLIVTGCTELSYGFSKIDFRIKWLNPLEVAARVLFDLWQGKRTIESLDQSG